MSFKLADFSSGLKELAFDYFSNSNWCFKKYEPVYFQGFFAGRHSLLESLKELEDINSKLRKGLEFYADYESVQYDRGEIVEIQGVGHNEKLYKVGDLARNILSTEIKGKDGKTVMLNEVFGGGTPDSDDEI
jgi:hypothetical protein